MKNLSFFWVVCEMICVPFIFLKDANNSGADRSPRAREWKFSFVYQMIYS